MSLDHVRPPPAASNTSDDDARAFLQERLAYLGRIYALIGITFYLAGNLAGLVALPHDLGRRLVDPSTWVVPAACSVYFMQWWILRRGVVSQPLLRVIDGVTTMLAVVFHSLMVFTEIPGEAPGMSYTRALLLVNFGLIVRAIIVPSSARRTLAYGIAASVVAAVAGKAWYFAQPAQDLPSALQMVWTGMWALGGGVIAALASHVIYGLRREVREARRLGQYTLLEKIGEGGMGAVYRAQSRDAAAADRHQAAAARIGRVPSACSASSARCSSPASSRTRTRSRSSTTAARPTASSTTRWSTSTASTSRISCASTAPQPPGRVVHLMRQVAGSLSEAHDIGLVHRDIKPSNVILVPERGGAPDVAKVVDFGLVKDLDETAWRTQEGRLFGTPHYLSPEAISSASPVGPASDLYSLGCVGYFLLTGQRVFEGQSVIEVATQHLTVAPVPPAERLGRPVSASLSAIVLSLLEKKVDQRPTSARALIAMLDAVHDVESWSSDQARIWWSRRGADVIERLRRVQPEPVEQSRETHTLVTAKISA